MNNEIKILVVDDEPLNLAIMQELLEEQYEHIDYAQDGLECLSKVKDSKPDIVFLDVSMPNMDGYQACREIKKIEGLEDVIIVFVSASGTAEERMQGFEVGGYDYIIKPFREQELLNKLNNIISYKKEKLSLQEQLKSMQDVAFNVMAGSAEIGYVIQYLNALFNSSTVAQIMDATIEFTNTLDLNVCVRINIDDSPLYKVPTGLVPPLEKEVMELLSSKGRIYRFEQRCQFNFTHILMLVKNMPIEDELKYGRIIDILPTAMEGANSCLIGLSLKKYESENIKITQTVRKIEDIQNNVNTNIEKVSVTNNQALETLYETLENNLPFMGLEEEQEKLITHAIDKVAETVKHSISSLEIIDTDISKIKKLIQHI